MLLLLLHGLRFTVHAKKTGNPFSIVPLDHNHAYGQHDVKEREII
jgi:hypothetical protein